MSRSREKVKAAIVEVLTGLTEDERRLFSEVMKVEAENLHLKKPHIKDELVKKVRQVIK